MRLVRFVLPGHRKFTETERRFKFHLKFQDYTEQELKKQYGKGLVTFMKKKIKAVLLSVALGAFLLNGCGGAGREADRQQPMMPENSDAVYGEVSKVADGSITIKVGTNKAMENPKDRDTEKKEEKPSMLELTGEEQEILITEDTVIKKQNMGGLAGPPEDGEPPQEDGRQDTEDGERGKATDGERPEGPRPDMEGSGNMPDVSEKDIVMEEIAVSDISEGDTVMVVISEEKNAEEPKSAAEITVMPARGGWGSHNSPDGQEDVERGTV